jgi:hypothetical protein
MQSMILRKSAKITSPITMPTNDVVSDDYMIDRGFVEMTPSESRRYSRFFECADRHCNHCTAGEHLAAFFLRAKHLLRR